MQGLQTRCPIHAVAYSTAYAKYRCRCEACRGWQREYERHYRAANPEKQREYKRRYRAANPEKNREYNRRWRAANPDKERKRLRKYNRRLRAKLVAFLGSSCERCNSVQYLDAHHVNGDGDEHRKRAGGFEGSYREILSGVYPREGVELLCRSCHMLAA